MIRTKIFDIETIFKGGINDLNAYKSFTNHSLPAACGQIPK